MSKKPEIRTTQAVDRNSTMENLMTTDGSFPDRDQNHKSTVDPFDPAALRLDPSYVETAGVKKLLTTVPVRKPNRQDFVRVNPDAAYRLSPTAIIELKEDREVYLLHPSIVADVPGEYVLVTLYTAINRQGVLSLWPVKLPGSDGKHNEWHRSAAEAAERAKTQWIRITANMSLGAYEICQATGNLSEPTWPDLSFQEILKVGFRGRFVERVDHPLIRRLKGLV
jgi:hypothetical protein